MKTIITTLLLAITVLATQGSVVVCDAKKHAVTGYLADKQALIIKAYYLDTYVDSSLVSSEFTHPLFIRLKAVAYWAPGGRNPPPYYLTFYCPREVYLTHKRQLPNPHDTLLIYFRPPYRMGTQQEGFYQLELCDRVVPLAQAANELKQLGPARKIELSAGMRIAFHAPRRPAKAATTQPKPANWLGLSMLANIVLVLVATLLAYKAFRKDNRR